MSDKQESPQLASTKLSEIENARTFYDNQWPDQLTSGVMFYNGQRITREEFTDWTKPPECRSALTNEINLSSKSPPAASTELSAEKILDQALNILAPIPPHTTARFKVNECFRILYDWKQEQLTETEPETSNLIPEVFSAEPLKPNEIHTMENIVNANIKFRERIAELEAKVQELEWFVSRVNEWVLPGERDTKDSALLLFQNLEAKVQELQKINQLQLYHGCDDGERITELEAKVKELEAEMKRNQEFDAFILQKQATENKKYREALEAIAIQPDLELASLSLTIIRELARETLK